MVSTPWTAMRNRLRPGSEPRKRSTHWLAFRDAGLADGAATAVEHQAPATLTGPDRSRHRGRLWRGFG